VTSDVERTLGALEAEAGDLSTAEPHLEAALDMAAPGRPTYALLSLVELARVAARRGDLDEAFDRLDRARASLAPDVQSPLTQRADALEVRIRATTGLEVSAAQLAQLGSGPRGTITEALYFVERGDPEAATTCLDTLHPTSEPRPRLERSLVEAQIALLQDDPVHLDTQLDNILDLSRTQGFARSVTDAGIAITRALDTRLRRSTPEPALVALEHALAEAANRPLPAEGGASPDHFSLTDRERTVLRYLPTRLTNREIASELYISMNTLKTHLRSTYRKLGVESRSAAVKQARHLGLL
jgi:LuxR family maltose regulon positive regulatory protein